MQVSLTARSAVLAAALLSARSSAFLYQTSVSQPTSTGSHSQRLTRPMPNQNTHSDICSRTKFIAIFDKLKKIAGEHIGVDTRAATSSTRIAGDLGADSLDKVELVMAIEEAFQVQISDDDAEKITTLGEATRYLCTKTP